MAEVMNESEIKKKLAKESKFMVEAVPEKQMTGSGFVLRRVLTHELHIAKYTPLKASGWFELPNILKKKEAIVNPKNEDNKCFMWAVLMALHAPAKNAERIKQYERYKDQYEWDMLKWLKRK